MVMRACVCLALVVALATPAHAKIGQASLGQLVQRSAAIAVVKVTWVGEVAGSRVARAEVVTSYRGPAAGQELIFLAERTWACDVSTAVAGETVLVFLYDMPDPRRARLAAAVKKGTPLYVIGHGGRGRLPLVTDDRGTVRVEKRVGTPEWPTDLAVDRAGRPALRDVEPRLR